MELTNIITQIPINGFVVVGCMILGYIMKKWMPTDNKIIPTVLPIVGAVISVPLSGMSVEIIIGGALSGAVSVGLHQVFAQYIEGTKDRNEILIDEEGEK